MKKLFTLLAVSAILFYSCNNDPVEDSINFNEDLSSRLVNGELKSGIDRRGRSAQSLMKAINEAVAVHNIQLTKIEMLGAENEGATIFFNDKGNKQLSSDFVPNDPRNGNGEDIPYVIDGTELGTSSGMSALATYNSTINAMNTWDNVTCSGGLDLVDLGVAPFDIGYVQFLLGQGGFGGFFPGTIVHAGTVSRDFFDALQPGGGNGILGVCFTFTWIDDIDGDNKGDVAIKEIYINDNFNWQDAPNDGLFDGVTDYETVVLHETGHALSQAHYGKLLISGANKLQFAPGAVMNAGYTIARRDIEQTDEAGHCSNWGNWPNN